MKGKRLPGTYMGLVYWIVQCNHHFMVVFGYCSNQKPVQATTVRNYVEIGMMCINEIFFW
jgi:hypothetical protein